MIKQIQLHNFKAHINSTLKMSNINIFTGLNGMGKSSVIQALLLLRQTFQKNMLDKGIELKGNLCSLGTAQDTINQSAENNLISFFLEFEDNKPANWIFEIKQNSLDSTYIQLQKDSIVDIELKNISLFNNNFQYISAFRNGPMQDYAKDSSSVELFNQISQNEGRCELIAHYIDYFRKDRINENLKKESDDDNIDLIFQVKRWLEEICPEINIFVRDSGTSYKISYNFDRGTGKTATQEFKAYNVGFGISFALPIIVAALHSPKDSIVIIENPEAHLHPEGIAKLMELLCKAAKEGVQFIIETHSDHVINGLLVAVKKGIINNYETSVYYFDREKTMHETKAIYLPVLEGGKIKQPPKGFFDRMNKDLKTLMNITK